MNRFTGISLLILLSLFFRVDSRGENVEERFAELASRVVIVVNQADPDSVKIGEYYARRRGIPEENIVAIEAPVSETISRAEFVEKIHNPLLRNLIEKDWVEGISSTLVDEEGRNRSLVEGHRMSYLVLCRGIPLRVENDPARITAEMAQAVKKEFLTNAASVDSELALLLVRAPSISYVTNPLFQNANPNPADLQRVIKVARLDGPTAKDAMALVDGALEAEEKGLRGRAYVDVTGPHANGVEWLRAVGKMTAEAGFDTTVRDGTGVFPVASRFDAPAIYFGWYANDLKGPFELEGFRFAPGAIALHIHSFSARTLRSETLGWTGPLVARGAAATLGNVYEPYLELSHLPHLFLAYLLQEGNVGDAAAFSIRAYSWQAILVGDPLYRPFAVQPEKQLAAALDGEGGEFGQYVVIREMNRLAAEGRREEALELGRKGMNRQPGLALALRLAELQAEGGERRAALGNLRVFERLRRISPMEAMVAKEAADLLVSMNERERALAVYETLLGDRALPAQLRKPLLEEGISLATREGKSRLARNWRTDLDGMSAAGGR